MKQAWVRQKSEPEGERISNQESTKLGDIYLSDYHQIWVIFGDYTFLRILMLIQAGIASTGAPWQICCAGVLQGGGGAFAHHGADEVGYLIVTAILKKTTSAIFTNCKCHEDETNQFLRMVSKHIFLNVYCIYLYTYRRGLVYPALLLVQLAGKRPFTGRPKPNSLLAT